MLRLPSSGLEQLAPMWPPRNRHRSYKPQSYHISLSIVINKPHRSLSEIILDDIRPTLLVPEHRLLIWRPFRPVRQVKTMVVRIERVHESNVRAHDVLAVLTDKRRYQAETVKSHIRRVEGSKHWKIGQVAKQANLAKDWEALFD